MALYIFIIDRMNSNYISAVKYYTEFVFITAGLNTA
jgi:hypothetical protein